MRTRERLFALLASLTIALLSGCGASSHTYTLSNLTPSEIVAGGEDFVLLVSGTNFKSDTMVLFADQTLTPTHVSSTGLQVLVPGSAIGKAGVVDVAVTGSQTSAALKFTIKNPAPTISAISQAEVLLNSTSISLDITGTNFVSTSAVMMGSTPLTPTVVSATKMTVAVPDALLTVAQVMPLVVVNPTPGGGASSNVDFTVLNPVPAISSLSIESTLLNSDDFELVLTGTGFAPGLKIGFGPTALDPLSITPTQVSALIPKTAVMKAAIHDVTIANGGPGGGRSNALRFTVNNPQPALASLSVSKLLVGGAEFSLDMSGSGFVPGETIVHFGTSALTPAVASSTQMSVVVPKELLAKSGTVPVSITTGEPGGGASNTLEFTIENPSPTLTSLLQDSITAGSGDFALTVAGTNFIPSSVVSFAGSNLLPTATSATQLTVTVPASSIADGGVYPILIINPEPGGGRSESLSFTVNNAVPTITALSLDSVLLDSADFELVLTGTGFAKNLKINFGPTILDATVTSSTQASVLIPNTLLKEAAIHDVTISNGGPGGGKSNALRFTVQNPVPTLTAMSQESVATDSAEFALTVTGTHFIPSAVVSFAGNNLEPTARSATQLTVTVPASALIDGGVYPVLVSNPRPGGGGSNALSFTINNPAPTLSALSPTTVIRQSSDFILELSGTGFAHQSTVQFGSTVLIPTSYTPTTLSVLVPVGSISNSGPVDVSVTNPNPGGGASGSLRIVVANPVPHTQAALPTSLNTSTSDVMLVLNGTGFNVDTVVTAGTEALAIVSTEPTTLTVAVPSALLTSAGTLVFTATNPEPGGGVSEPVTVTVHERVQTTGWQTVVNNRMTVPGSEQLFNSYNQPSVNARGMVVFKGQSKGTSGPTVGIYVRDMSQPGNLGQINKITGKDVAVPQPNNTTYNGVPAAFIQFPSFPRIDLDSDTVAFRGQSRPTWTYTGTDGLETRIGSTGVYSNPGGGELKSGVGLLGAAPGFEFLQVPGAPAGTRFDQFPGSPAIVDGNIILFKGNYTVGLTGKTGVFFRDIVGEEGKSPVKLIANSDTLIPGQPEGGTTLFGSTAPPSAAKDPSTHERKVVFVGLDNEDEPTLGGIYIAPIEVTPTLPPTLTAIASIGSQVPGEADGVTFTRFGEGLSFDGRYVSFWGAWGHEMRTKVLKCVEDGNKDIIAFCNEMYPNGYEAQVPVHQGVFVYDTSNGLGHAVAKNNNGEFEDFVYWVFSGRPPTVGEGGDEIPEPPRWRSSAFIAVNGQGDTFKATFKANTGSVDGVYLARGGGPDPLPIQTVVDTTFAGREIDTPDAPMGSVIATIGIERDGLRSDGMHGDWLVVTSSMLDPLTTESNAGVYVTQIMP